MHEIIARKGDKYRTFIVSVCRNEIITVAVLQFHFELTVFLTGRKLFIAKLFLEDTAVYSLKSNFRNSAVIRRVYITIITNRTIIAFLIETHFI